MLKGYWRFIWLVVISFDGNILVSGSWDNMIKFWDFNGNSC